MLDTLLPVQRLARPPLFPVSILTLALHADL
jgi:hypothetical protein